MVSCLRTSLISSHTIFPLPYSDPVTLAFFQCLKLGLLDLENENHRESGEIKMAA